jgi:putative restriction endonuclease
LVAEKKWFAGMHGVFSHKPNSPYKDVKGMQYHFPRVYKSRVEQMVGDKFVYYEELKGHEGRYYTGCGIVTRLREDPELDGHYYADLQDFIDFDRLVPYREDGGFESKLVMSNGNINGGTAQSAVRLIDEQEFAKIILAGLSEEPMWPDRTDSAESEESNDAVVDVFFDSGRGQPALIGAPYERPIILQLANRKWRDQKFKLHVRTAYDRTCAFTGLRLINGRGRPEVEAAHIRPVEHGGNDWIRNGIALSGTVHWMFDRGLLSLGDDLKILQSRKLNHDVSGLLLGEMVARVPSDEALRPHPEYLSWHRTHHGF